mmetsp:Transcript_46104/g.147241  ORF Transcript_46104/g.147241 Transcript_46104/m.147241 type:complete len:218 (+) Transcript_46104:95-748(+)
MAWGSHRSTCGCYTWTTASRWLHSLVSRRPCSPCSTAFRRTRQCPMASMPLATRRPACSSCRRPRIVASWLPSAETPWNEQHRPRARWRHNSLPALRRWTRRWQRATAWVTGSVRRVPLALRATLRGRRPCRSCWSAGTVPSGAQMQWPCRGTRRRPPPCILRTSGRWKLWTRRTAPRWSSALQTRARSAAARSSRASSALATASLAPWRRAASRST